MLCHIAQDVEDSFLCVGKTTVVDVGIIGLMNVHFGALVLFS